jgi:4-oxalocrotonate tautomerase
MPIVQIHLMSGRTNEQKRKLVKSVTQAICDSVDVNPENVRIILSEMSDNNYSFAGELVIDKQKKK